MAEQDPPKDTPGDDTWTTYSPPVSQPVPETPPVSEAPEVLPPTHVPYGQAQTYSGTYPPAPGSSGTTTVVSSQLLKGSGRSGCGIVGLVVGLVIFLPTIFGVIAGVKAISGGFDELDDGLGNPFSAPEPPDMESAAAFAGVLDALREETGGTTVFDASIYGEYAVLYVPADKTSKRYYSYYYDGDLRRTSQGTTDYKRFDLSTIDASVLTKLFERAETLVEDPTSKYVLIRSPEDHMNGAWFSVYATNDFMESGYFTADKAGKVVFESPVQ